MVIIGEGLWRRRFRADPGIIGRRISLNSTPVLVAGVLPASFEPPISAHVYGEGAEIWAPMGYDASLPYACRSCGHLVAFERLAPGATPADAVADLDVVLRSLRQEYPRLYTEAGMAVVPLHDVLVGQVRPALRVLAAAVAFVLLIAGVNAAHLLLARAIAVLLAAVGIYGVISYSVAQRTRELGVRVALGAQQGDLFRLVLHGGMRPALGGIAVGLIAAFWLTRFLQGLLYDVSPADPLTFTCVVVLLLVVTIVAHGLPARRAPGVDPIVALRDE